MKNKKLFAISVIVGSSVFVSNAHAEGNPSAGEKAFTQWCKVCHTVEERKHRVGPSLSGIIGRKAGSSEGYKYSDAMIRSNITWNEDTLNNFMISNKNMVPGTKETFPGIRDQQTREDLIAFLKSH